MNIEKIEYLIDELIEDKISFDTELDIKKLIKEGYRENINPILDLSTEDIEKHLIQKCTNKNRLTECIEILRSKNITILDNYLKLLHYFTNNSLIMRNFAEAKIDEVKSKINQVKEESFSRNPQNKINNLKHCISWDFVNGPEINFGFIFNEHDTDVERYLVEDLLNLFTGCHGRLIKANPINDENEIRTFRISSQISASLQGLVKRLLPLASYYSTIIRFIEKNMLLDAGRVNHALSGKLKEELQYYMLIILEVENEHRRDYMDLNLMWSELLEMMHRMKVLAELTTSISKMEARGGKTLTILHSLTANYLSDPEIQSLCYSLTKSASQPYLESLSSWIYLGKVYDPFDEFMISEKPNGIEEPLSEVNWNRKFSIRKEYIPNFLSYVIIEIVISGKYIDIIRRSLGDKRNIPCLPMEPIVYDMIDLKYINMIKRAYKFAKSTLFNLVVNDYDVIGRLKTAKSFFSIEHGDFLYHLLNNCLEELQRPAAQICPVYLPSLVKTSIQTSSIGFLPYSSEINVYLEKGSLKWMLNNLSIKNDKKPSDLRTGLEVITLTMKIDWPLCIVITTKSLKCYQMLFRHFFNLKYIYMKLSKLNFYNEILQFCLIKHSMTVFVQCCISYMYVDAVQTNWNAFEFSCIRMTGITQMIESHHKYIFSMLNGCMLTSPVVYEHLNNVLEVCLRFTQNPELKYQNIFIESLCSFIKSLRSDSTWYIFDLTLIHTFSFLPQILAI